MKEENKTMLKKIQKTCVFFTVIIAGLVLVIGLNAGDVAFSALFFIIACAGFLSIHFNVSKVLKSE